MSVKELKYAVVSAGLVREAFGMTEKEDLVRLLESSLKIEGEEEKESKNQCHDPQEIFSPVTSSASQATLCRVEKVSWRSAGQDESETIDTQILIVKRLNWCLFWKNDELIVWDYSKEVLVHVLLPYYPNGEPFQVLRKNLIDMRSYHPQGYALYTVSNAHSFLCIVLDFLPIGGRSSMYTAQLETAMAVPPHLFKIDMEVWDESVNAALRQAYCYTPYKKENNSSWILGVSKQKSSSVAIYTENSIVSNSAYGPYAIKKHSPDIELFGHDHTVYEIDFFTSSSSSKLQIITCSADKTIKIWGLNGQVSNTITFEKDMQRIFCLSKSLLFIAKTERFFYNSVKDKEAIVLAYDLKNANLQASLIFTKLIAEVTELNIIKDTNRLLAITNNGYLYIWDFFEETSTFTFKFSASIRIFESINEIRGNLKVENNIVYVAAENSLLAFDLEKFDPSSRETSTLPSKGDGTPFKVHNLGVKAKALNCLHCKQWLISKSSLCSGCRLVYFCDKSCQKAEWLNHKAFCNKNSKCSSK